MSLQWCSVTDVIWPNHPLSVPSLLWRCTSAVPLHEQKPCGRMGGTDLMLLFTVWAMQEIPDLKVYKDKSPQAWNRLRWTRQSCDMAAIAFFSSTPCQTSSGQLSESIEEVGLYWLEHCKKGNWKKDRSSPEEAKRQASFLYFLLWTVSTAFYGQHLFPLMVEKHQLE